MDFAQRIRSATRAAALHFGGSVMVSLLAAALVFGVGGDVDGGMRGNRILNFRCGGQHGRVAVGRGKFSFGFPH